ncbi:UDP-N-acetylmuramoyl-L-alanyl-D-glutamate--2,6-diaminopimelate ligase [Marinimicrobium sp. ABcell2]|uniref:UDP-N-acetylmuramoyl-L-alanyl-D-glutamate--2, 6-diaminopimelate ligase n=1 Tax=Marinimicrobium sp. ABcell2 TaxID=3069751 RepID=UPI0027B16E08|nr:UDP-N-acetylmuramoyl-L-alanyl-D-glutamate--2,6-diaminopimelate ligase [Marinimicrobium sp. ABcell2]MDQ2075082.1 UDP-N-acetylmuramoyl-L-alanyl-D-glutamate--2,6-diaminopimelate ligase [Marinimicrobium sp. ABcell2]
MALITSQLTLGQLLPDHDLAAASATVVTGLSLDSRALKAGEIFVALSGAQHDGRDFIEDAVAKGASGVLVEAGERWQDPVFTPVPIIPIAHLGSELSAIAGRCYGDPSHKVWLVGITGTNGKTTCSVLLAQLTSLLRERAAVVGTLGYGVLESDAPLGARLDALTSTGLTTPDAIGVQRILADLVARGAACVSMEVSSHSLVQGRVAALQFDAAIFTNLTHDHLDYHGDMESYGRAKQRLLTMPGLRHAIVNLDDPWAAGLLTQLPSGVSGLSYSVANTDADIHLAERVDQRSGVSALVVTPWGQGEVHTRLLGRFNMGNLLAAIAAACCEGHSLEDVLNAVPHLQAAPGRMQPVIVDDDQQDIQVIVDYAHTPDALKNSLQALKDHLTGRLWCVFGCGGDRDKAKRPAMGALAERYSDFTIVTNDNPRTEDPAQIASDIVRGMDNPSNCLVIADRAQAIDLAVQQARAGDTVLIAGKGHEDYQLFADKTLPFSDVEHVAQSLQRRLDKQREEVSS